MKEQTITATIMVAVGDYKKVMSVTKEFDRTLFMTQLVEKTLEDLANKAIPPTKAFCSAVLSLNEAEKTIED